uniref:US12 prolyl 3-hydroxylase n=1 Tax=Timema bartmani TaxID=61472 RepID=A0A7R9F9E6_9NEOP|nr:unnamed protein product [Timema bartmani]
MVPMPLHETDLFKFCQSSPLTSAGKDTPVSALVQFLERVLRGLVEEVTGLTLDGAVTSTMSLYGYTDYLLCHDDRQNNRKIAFIWYLTENWREEYGGHLDLFDSKGGYPTEIVHSILPEENSLVFFEVCDRSFHQVSEVLTSSKLRLSVNGWFHLPTVPVLPSPTNGLRHSTTLTLKTPSYALVESEMSLFVSNEYLQHDQQIRINKLIEENSEISLDNFLKSKWADKITTELCSSDIIWHLRGPPNRRKYEVADERSLGPTVTRFLNLMKSQHMFALLEKMTQLELTSKWAHKNGEQSLVTPKCGYQVQRWRRGFYTLATDEDFCETVPVLDVFINFNCAEWTQESGGFMSYIGRGDEDENHPAENLVNNDPAKKWKCSSWEKSVSVVLQLDRAVVINSIDIGNQHSAFIEVLVGRSSSPDEPFQVLLVASSFMSPMEARNGTMGTRVRMFSSEQLRKPVVEQRWDRVKVICSQPFNKHVQYGLAFIALNSTESAHQAEGTEHITTKIGKFPLRQDDDDADSTTTPPAKQQSTTTPPAKQQSTTTPPAKQQSTTTPPAKQQSTTTPPAKQQSTTTPPAKQQSTTTPPAKQQSTTTPPAKQQSTTTPPAKQQSTTTPPAKQQSTTTPPAKQQSTTTPPAKQQSTTTPPAKQQSTTTPPAKQQSTTTPPAKQQSTTTPPAKQQSTTTLPAKQQSTTTPPAKQQSTTIPRANENSFGTKQVMKRPQRKLFSKLLEGVVFVMSGYQNPHRAHIRTKALEMGAKYKTDWGVGCTHLICAFSNTPKFQQVRGRGHIVTKEWIEDCYNKRRRLPWRRVWYSGMVVISDVILLSGMVVISDVILLSGMIVISDVILLVRYALDQRDKGPDSEEEILELQPSSDVGLENGTGNYERPADSLGVKECTVNNSGSEECTSDSPDVKERTANDPGVQERTVDSSDSDTEDDIERVRTAQKDDSYSGDTDVETTNEVIKDNTPLPHLPTFFNKITFYLSADLNPDLRARLHRYIVAFKGKVSSDIDSKVDIVVSNSRNAAEEGQSTVPPQWVWDCCDKEQLLSTQT